MVPLSFLMCGLQQSVVHQARVAISAAPACTPACMPAGTAVRGGALGVRASTFPLWPRNRQVDDALAASRNHGGKSATHQPSCKSMAGMQSQRQSIRWFRRPENYSYPKGPDRRSRTLPRTWTHCVTKHGPLSFSVF